MKVSIGYRDMITVEHAPDNGDGVVKVTIRSSNEMPFGVAAGDPIQTQWYRLEEWRAFSRNVERMLAGGSPLEWNGSVCGIVTPYDPEADGHEDACYVEGDEEECTECDTEAEVCIAYLRRAGTEDTLEDVRSRKT